MARILSAMSGGVDSSVATALLVEQGHEVVGAYMKNWINEENIIGDCPWQQDIKDARLVAEQLQIEFRVVNMMQDYRNRIVEYLIEGYRRGITPNPDVMCNREIKFGVFLKYAIEQGFDFVATGHYAKVEHSHALPSRMLRGADGGKDQTYFLALMQQDQARRALFPIGGLLKSDVRMHALALGLSTAKKKDSQGICFIGNVKMSDFLRAFLPDAPGDIVNVAGKKLGTHRGLHLHTLGQRRGLGVASNAFKEAYVVVEKRAATRELVVAFDHPDAPHLYAKQCRVTSLSWVDQAPSFPTMIAAQPRYRCPGQVADVVTDGPEALLVSFHHSQRALAPGQICAFYDGDQLLGGGVFERIDY